MWKTIVRRMLIMIPQLLALSLVIFLIAQLMPGDALTGMMDPEFTGQDIEAMREALGLNRPWPVRYVEWIRGMLTGDFGRSYVFHRPVIDLIGERAPNTFRLALTTTVFFYLIGIPLGVIAGRYRDRWPDKVVVFYTFFAIAMPVIIFAILNLWIFAWRLGWFPMMGSVDARITVGTLQFHLSRLHHLILPALTGALLGTAGIINILRDRIVDTENADFITTARSKGVPKRVLYNRHVFKNSALPIVSGFGFALAGLLGGSVFIEQIFGFPGMGSLFVTSIVSRDFPTANALIMIYGVLLILGTLLSDIFMMMLDPRIRIK